MRHGDLVELGCAAELARELSRLCMQLGEWGLRGTDL